MPSSPAPRGVFRAVAPTGYVAVQVIDSHGEEFAELRVRARAFDPAMIITLRALLEEHDPQLSDAYMLTLLRAALPRRVRKGRPRKGAE